MVPFLDFVLAVPTGFGPVLNRPKRFVLPVTLWDIAVTRIAHVMGRPQPYRAWQVFSRVFLVFICCSGCVHYDSLWLSGLVSCVEGFILPFRLPSSG